MEIVNFREHPPGDKIIATFDVYLGPEWQITFCRIKLMKGKNGVFLAMPCFMEEQFGQKKFFPYIQFSKEKKSVFDAKVFELLRNYLQLP